MNVQRSAKHLVRQFSSAVHNQPSIHVTTLANGVRVATQKRAGSACAVELLVDAGCRDDAAGKFGAGYLVNQLAPQNVSPGICSMGGSLKTYYGREKTSYSLTAGPGSEKAAIEAATKLIAPAITPEGTAAARGALIANHQVVPTTGSKAVLVDQLHQSCFRDSNLGNPLKGTAESLPTLTADDLKAYVAKNHTGERTTIAVVGDVNHADVVAAVSGSPLASLGNGTPEIVSEKPYFLGSDIIYRNDEMGPLAFITLAYEGIPSLSSDTLTFDLFQQTIGSFDKDNQGYVPGRISANRTKNEIASKTNVGCAEHYRAYNIQYRDTGLFGWFAICDEVAVDHCMSELIFSANVLTSCITEEEIMRSKRELFFKKFTKAETSDVMASEIADNLRRYNRVISLEEIQTRLNAIDSEEVKRVAYKYLHDAEIAIVALGPMHGYIDYYWFRRMTHMWRY